MQAYSIHFDRTANRCFVVHVRNCQDTNMERRCLANLLILRLLSCMWCVGNATEWLLESPVCSNYDATIILGCWKAPRPMLK